VIADFRFIRCRDDRYRVAVDGRRVDAVEAPDVPTALRQLARALDGIAWASGRTVEAEIGDERSRLYGGARAEDSDRAECSAHRDDGR
jgi:hypothetical protein